ncbi:MAG: dTDP-4-dehydrorhamnose 3,5-epimerase family protein [Patescibacteria group bacterium]
MELITLKNKDKVTLIDDIIIHPLKVNRDESGVLVETLRKDWKDIYGLGREFSMQYYSITDSGVARDENVWHYHPTVQEDRFLVAFGEIVTAVADNRYDSSTNGLLNLFYMQADQEPYILLIPKNTLHGFMVVSRAPAVLLNFPTSLYNPKEEERIPYSEALVKLPNGPLFNWNQVRKLFNP